MRIREGRQRGELGHLLDGFPRTQLQAQAMDEFVDTRLVINLQLREEVSLCWHSHCLRGTWRVFRPTAARGAVMSSNCSTTCQQAMCKAAESKCCSAQIQLTCSRTGS